MTEWTELARRSADGVDVTLLWMRDGGAEGALVCVCDRRKGAYFEIPVERDLILDVFRDPFAHRASSSLDYEDRRLAA